MNYERLEVTYRALQEARIVKAVRALAERSVTSGRTVPSADDLVIGSGRRLKAAVMFLDISRFSSRSSEESRDQDSNLIMLMLFFSEMVRIAEDYGGTVEKNTGDGLMAYFEDGGGTPSRRSGSHSRK